jgi:cell fate regulator YaaT (PSP1 superfamily)
MKVAEVQYSPWDKIYDFSFDEKDTKDKLSINDYVVVDTKIGQELGKVVGVKDLTDEEVAERTEPLKPVLRIASKEDLDTVLEYQKQKPKAFTDCRTLIKKHNLPIKLVDVHFNFDGSRITFAFIADGRVDFRDLLKDLIKSYKKNIRLQQLGIRDEIKVNGDIGCCGRNVCCQGFFKDLGNVTSDLADLQQVSHRGSERLSGVCGRLKCCLTYEKSLYDELANKLPMIGEKINTKHGKGEVIGWHVLKQTVDVLLDDKETIVEVPIAK